MMASSNSLFHPAICKEKIFILLTYDKEKQNIWEAGTSQ